MLKKKPSGGAVDSTDLDELEARIDAAEETGLEVGERIRAPPMCEDFDDINRWSLVMNWK